MKRVFFIFLILLFVAPLVYAQQEGVAIQRVITNTRSELGQLASSGKAREISGLMEKFDTQYTTWNNSCGQQSFNPDQISDACKNMAEQMRETGIALYGKLSEYLPDVAARYEQGARSAQYIVQKKAIGQTPAELYEKTKNGIQMDAVMVSGGGQQGGAMPFNVTEDYPDQTDELFSTLEKLVPDYGHEVPEAIRAGNTQINMTKKARKARYLAAQFEKAKFALDAQRDYGEIILKMTEAVEAMPNVLGIQYTGTRLSARPNRKVLDYYRPPPKKTDGSVPDQGPVKDGGGFKPRS
jgi:hypothetical protein